VPPTAGPGETTGRRIPGCSWEWTWDCLPSIAQPRRSGAKTGGAPPGDGQKRQILRAAPLTLFSRPAGLSRLDLRREPVQVRCRKRMSGRAPALAQKRSKSRVCKGFQSGRKTALPIRYRGRRENLHFSLTSTSHGCPKTYTVIWPLRNLPEGARGVALRLLRCRRLGHRAQRG